MVDMANFMLFMFYHNKRPNRMINKKKKKVREFPGGLAAKDLVAQVTAMAQVQSLAWELLYALGTASPPKR